VCQGRGGWHAPAPLLFFLVGLAVFALAVLPGCRRIRAPKTPPIPEAPSSSSLAFTSEPRTLEVRTGTLTVDERTRIAVPDRRGRRVAELFARWLGLPPSAIGDAGSGAIVLEIAGAPAAADDLAASAYRLDVTPARAHVLASNEAGLFYGAQQLAQLAGARPIGAARPRALPRTVPALVTTDAPRFRFRAMHLDVARHFFPKEVVLRYVDLLAFYKFNVFHWHLTDDQGFRFEVKKHPELTAAAGKTGFYTQDDAREVVAYAAERGITVVPEIEMPGHARAILVSHPELSCTGKPLELPATWGVFEDVLCAGNDATFALIEDVLREVAAVFPSKLVHVGGDEVPHERWDACPKCAAKKKALKTDTAGLQAFFHARVAEILKRLGRTPMLWDEAADLGAPEGAVIVAWRGIAEGLRAARAGSSVVMAPHGFVYFNVKPTPDRSGPGHEGFLPWSKVLAFDPGAAGDPHVLGGEGALWTEHVESVDDIDHLTMPRMQALAEALWSMPAPPSIAHATGRFIAQRPMLDASGIRYYVEPPEGLRPKAVFLDRAAIALHAPGLFRDGVVRYTLDGSEPTGESPNFGEPITVTATTKVSARLFVPGGRESATVRGVFEKQVPRPPRALPAKDVQYTYYEGDFHRLPDFDRLAPVRTGRLDRVRLDPSFRAERFAVRYDGSLEAKTTAVYRVTARADDGVRVFVDGELVLEDDGEHEPRETDGEIALAAGTHALRVEYFQGAEGKELGVWALPNR
jgi:hexosaminidase